MTDRLIYRPWFIASATTLLFIAVLAMFGEFVTLERDRMQQRLHTVVLSQASAVRAQLEGTLNSTVYLTRSLTAYVATHPDVSEQEFSALAAEIMSEAPIVRNIGLAPDNVLRYVYPRKGNEQAIGLRYLDNRAQRDAVLHAIETRHTVVAGPVKLVQGGEAFINRSPIYIKDARAADGLHYWGLASVVIDQQALFQLAGLSETRDGVRYALRGKDGLGAAGAPFFGNPRLFVEDSVLLSITLPEGSWQLAAMPENGWNHDQGLLSFYYLGGAVLGLLLSLLLYILMRERQQVHHFALHDGLTGLANRRMFNLRIEHALQQATRRGDNFALLCLDLDDFKPINDRYGHRGGDQVLTEIGKRLRQTLRRVDTVARIGGDEFMIILEEIPNPAEARIVAGKLIDALSAPIEIGTNLVKVGVSIGISHYPFSGLNTDDLIRAADQAMYRAKERGKNRYECDGAAATAANTR